MVEVGIIPYQAAQFLLELCKYTNQRGIAISALAAKTFNIHISQNTLRSVRLMSEGVNFGQFL